MSKNKNKKQDQNQQANEQQTQNQVVDQTNREQEQKEINPLEIELNKQKQINQQLVFKVAQLEQQINKLNDDFINQVQAKANQAKELLNQKLNELEQNHNQKVVDAVYKIFSQKFDALLVAINHFSKIVDNQYDDEKLNAFILGFRMIANQMIDGLADLEISKIIPTVGSLIDDSCMEAVELVDSLNYNSLTIVEVVETGFKYQDKVIKYATVKVAK
ncbi:hypothetical protein JM47_02620 [Ureaplasma diversum]|uniref:Protein GrpE n=1 Tax=Ureaplasma diversum TaxID=42094 RepID=A0A0C5RC42_9BACT|nr:nucleotide exchange factor GrpE [Ureaplasma diversum]AJQ45451.1 hypothetical protein JM47_02620 [Ureaplasma diversum]